MGSCRYDAQRSGEYRTFIIDLYRALVKDVPVAYAILDLQFTSDERKRFAVASSSGDVHLYSFQCTAHVSVTLEHTITVAPSSDILALSLKFMWNSNMMAVTLSNGNVAILDTGNVKIRHTLPWAHSLEAWVAAWSPLRERLVLYSGGDDSVFHRHDCSNQQESGVPRNHADFMRDTKLHGAGVTAILPLYVDQDGKEFIITGSYDEFVRVLQITPGSKRAKLLLEQRMDGGVWQLRLLNYSQPSDTGSGELCYWILASCMHAGCRVMKIFRPPPEKEEDWSLQVVGKFEEHESMNYASDAQQDLQAGDLKDLTFISTSFYDRKLCVWKLEET
ncbi:MAG: hypothetical protein LQ345_005808 [Seirophora villosa]|nr:MAG: hypothetical protein LQ345_005808 [Seirophora villosa]